MNITLEASHVIQMAPQAGALSIGETINVSLPSSASSTGTAVVSIQRMTEHYFYLSN